MTKGRLVKKQLNVVANGSSNLPAENIVRGQEYAITLNPEIQYFGDSDRFILFTANSYKFLKDLKYSKFQLFPELSPLGRLHWHGKIIIKDVPYFYLYDVPRLINFGHLKIDVIGQPPVGMTGSVDVWNKFYEDKDHEWFKYCKKQYSIFKELTECNLNYMDGHMSIGWVDTITKYNVPINNDHKESPDEL